MMILRYNKLLVSEIMIALTLALSCVPAFASKVYLIDVSGSIEGFSSIRSERSLSFIKEELLSDIDNWQTNSEYRFITFTDKPSKPVVFSGLQQDEAKKYVLSLSICRGNTDIVSALKESMKYENQNDCVILISDGLASVGDLETLRALIKGIANSSQFGKQYMLLLSENDLRTPLVKEYSDNSNLHLIRSLNEVTEPSCDISLVNEDTDSLCKISHIQVDSSKGSIEADSFKRYLMMSILLILILLLIVFVIYIFPAFAQTSAPILLNIIHGMYSLPKPFFKVIYSILPKNFKEFLRNFYPNYDDFRRGPCEPRNDKQHQMIDKYGPLKYKDGEPDFSPYAKGEAYFPEGIGKYMDPNRPASDRSSVQDEAGRRMLNNPKMKRIISDYHKKSVKDLTMQDYYDWKDDVLNRGKPNFNPLVPHETPDGKRVIYVPQDLHDAFRHSGGISRIRDIRNAFPKAK